MSLIGRMMLVALVVGTSVTVSATERVTLSLVAGGVLGWSFVPLLQLFTGVLLVRRLDPELLDRYFATHWPWSIWIVAAHTMLLLVPGSRGYGIYVSLTIVVPMLWTIWLLFAFCRENLRLDVRQCRRRIALHQGLTYVILLVYVSFAVALWPRIVGLFA